MTPVTWGSIHGEQFRYPSGIRRDASKARGVHGRALGMGVIAAAGGEERFTAVNACASPSTIAWVSAALLGIVFFELWNGGIVCLQSHHLVFGAQMLVLFRRKVTDYDNELAGWHYTYVLLIPSKYGASPRKGASARAFGSIPVFYAVLRRG